MPVKDADPEARGLDDAFAGAMGAPPKPKEPASPPVIDPEAPHGRDEAGKPLAPYGLNKDGSVRKSPAGRKAKDEDRPRIAAPAEAAAIEAPAPGRDYTEGLAGFAEAAWFGVSAVGKGGSAIPLIGKFVQPYERRLSAQAGVFGQMSPKLVAAVNLAAQHNARARAFAEKIQTGDVTWYLTCGFLVMPFITMSAAIWKGDEALARVGDGLSVDKLAAANDEKFDAYMTQIADQMETAAAEQAAAMMAAATQNGEVDEAALAALQQQGMEGPA